MDKNRAVEILRKFRDTCISGHTETIYIDGISHREMEDALNLAIDLLRRRK